MTGVIKSLLSEGKALLEGVPLIKESEYGVMNGKKLNSPVENCTRGSTTPFNLQLTLFVWPSDMYDALLLLLNLMGCC